MRQPYIFKTQLTARQWQTAYRQLDIHRRNLLTSWEQGETFKELGYQVWRWAVFKEQQAVALVLAVDTPARRGRFLKAFVNFADDPPNGELAALVFEKLRATAETARAVFVNLQTCLMATPANRSLMKRLKLKPSLVNLTTPSTLKIDLKSLTAESLFASKRYVKTRYKIRKAEKAGLRVVVDNSPEGQEAFLELHHRTQLRQRFVQEPLDFIRAQCEVFRQAEKLAVYLVYESSERREALAGGVMIDVAGERSYLYGASSPAGHKSHASYLLQKQAILDALEDSMEAYNLWGIAPPQASPKHNFWGLTVFKLSFADRRYDYLPSWSLVIDRRRYFLIRMLTRLEKNDFLRRGLFKWRHRPPG